jgi:hypothetical protein
MARVAEDARAEAVNEVDLFRSDEIQRRSPGSEAKERVRRAAIDHCGAAPVRKRKRAVRNRVHPDLRMDSVGGLAARRGPGDDGDFYVLGEEVARKIVNGSFQTANAVERIDGAGDDRHANRVQRRFSATSRL